MICCVFYLDSIISRRVRYVALTRITQGSGCNIVSNILPPLQFIIHLIFYSEFDRLVLFKKIIIIINFYYDIV
jgi:hypothetical protein